MTHHCKAVTAISYRLTRSLIIPPSIICISNGLFSPILPPVVFLAEIHAVPCEFVTNFDPRFPLIAGGLLSGESSIGFVQVRLKKHRWHKRILKNRDPLMISLGWRRFQTIPVYSVQDHNFRQRMLKYTPEHLHCTATFWGPITPQSTGFLALQHQKSASDFRIAATGVILDLDKSATIVKKLKLTGSPLKIFKKTAFIKDMFTTALEVAKFEGAMIRTVSGIRGVVKKAIKAPAGAFRATFEDKILLSDIVFTRTWFRVDIPKYYNPITSHLLPADDRAGWQGMKTVGQLRFERQLSAPQNVDSHYRDVKRKPRLFAPFVVPAKLKKDLPFSVREKAVTKAADEAEANRVAVIRQPEEQKMGQLMEMVRTLDAEKRRKEKIAMVRRVQGHRKEMRQMETQKLTKEKDIRKKMFQVLGREERKEKEGGGKAGGRKKVRKVKK